jgi:hypothetical protein
MTKKQTIIAIIAFVLAIVSFALLVDQNQKSQLKKEKEQKELQRKKTELRFKELQDSLKIVQDSLKVVQSYKDSIQIIKHYVSEPNSAGGVDLNIIWKNTSKRVVKYARFEVSAINSVGDEVYSEIGLYDGSKYVKVTGPVKPNKIDGYGTYWECVWYNSTIRKCVIRSVELEYMDGSKIQFSI